MELLIFYTSAALTPVLPPLPPTTYRQINRARSMPFEQLLSMFEGEFGDTYLTARTTKKIKATVTDEECFTLKAGKVSLRAGKVF